MALHASSSFAVGISSFRVTAIDSSHSTALRLFHFFQELHRVNHFERTKSPTKVFALIRIARHQVKQIFITADDVIGFGFNSQIDIWLIIYVSLIGKSLGSVLDGFSHTFQLIKKFLDYPIGQFGKSLSYFRAIHYFCNFGQNFFADVKTNKLIFSQAQTSSRWTAFARGSLQQHIAVKDSANL